MPSVKSRHIKALKRGKVDRLVEAAVRRGIRSGNKWRYERNLRMSITESLWASRWLVNWNYVTTWSNGYLWSMHWVLHVANGKNSRQYHVEFDKVGGFTVMAVFKPYAKRKSQAH